MSIGPYGPPSPTPTHTRTPHTPVPPATATVGATVAPTPATLPQTGADTTSMIVIGLLTAFFGIVLWRIGWGLRQR